MLGATLLGLACSPIARGQGIIIDRRPSIPIARSFEVKAVEIDARVRDQVAEVQVSQTFHNPGSVQIESEFLFPLPEGGAVQNFVLLVDGRELPSRLLNKDEARRIYEEIVRRKRDPALLEYMGRGLYRTSVFPIPPGADRKVTMRYTQVCKRDRDVIEFSYPLSTQKFTSKPIQRLGLHIDIRSKDAIKSIYSPSDDARIDRSGDHQARVSLERHDITPENDFRLLYTLADGAIGASILSYRPSHGEDGYFLLLASPEVKAPDTKPQPKTVVFVLDRSGSMAGKKIEQARQALKSLLNNLRDDDLFNIVVYDDRVESFRPEMERYSTRTREEAVRFVENIREGGSTNIDSALKTALGMIRDDARPSYVLFLTDGLPTAGETQELKIAEHCREANARRARLFCFGVGFDVNARLLDRLSGGNSGTSEYVKPDEDIETHVGRFYAKMSSPVLADLHVELSGTDLNRTYPRDLPDLFEGGQILWVGRYREPGRTTIRISGKIGPERRTFEFPAELVDAGRGGEHEFVARIWATRRIGDLIDQIDLHGQNKELVDELVRLSTTYGILTPYTSFLADENVPLFEAEHLRRRAGESLTSLNVLTGPSGVEQRDLKQHYLKAGKPLSLPSQNPIGGASMGSFGGAMRGMAGGMGGMGTGYASGSSGQMMSAGRAPRPQEAKNALRPGLVPGTAVAAAAKDADSPREEKASVRQIGSKTFYFKDHHWIDSTVDAEDEKKATVIRQFSDRFFELARTQSADLNQYLTFTESVTLKLGDQVYRIEPADVRP
jgi:Ca-activated chloride channel family protein